MVPLIWCGGISDPLHSIVHEDMEPFSFIGDVSKDDLAVSPIVVGDSVVTEFFVEELAHPDGGHGSVQLEPWDRYRLEGGHASLGHDECCVRSSLLIDDS